MTIKRAFFLFGLLSINILVYSQRQFDILNQYKYFVVKPINSKVDYAPAIEKLIIEKLNYCGIQNILDKSLMYDPQYDQKQIITCVYNLRNIGSPKVELKLDINFVDCDNTIVFPFTKTEKYNFYNEKSAIKFVATSIEPFSAYKYEYQTKNSTIVTNDQPLKNEQLKPIISDVDVDIPKSSKVQKNTYCLIIGNEDYSSYQKDLKTEVNVDFAENDARIFMKYCIQTFGIPERNIKLLINSTAGQILQSLDWLSKIAQADTLAELIFYYAGHGLPNEQTKEAYLMPVDVSGTNLDFAIKLTDVYKKITENNPVKSTAIIDACFSGGGRNEGLLALRGVKINPKESTVGNNLVVFTSSTGDESSSPYKEKGHGIFTYFFLKTIKETKGKLTYNELWQSVCNETKINSLLINNKVQTPQLRGTTAVENSWKEWSFIE